uniref:Leucine-rich repeat protein n=1 Tax=Panagrellus redivivus TaxID=6233 RepID=A0A7E5A003_PANRE
MLINCKLSHDEGCVGRSKASKPKPGSLTVARVRDEALRLTLNFGGTNNKANKVYRVTKDNINAVFDKFVNAGKLTISLSSPTVQIFVSNATDTKLLLKLSRTIMGLKNSGRLGPESVDHQGPPVARVTDVRTTVEIKSKAQYAENKEFGPFIESLTINTKFLKSVDSRWFKLANLTLLDLSGNNLGAMDKFGWRKFEEIKKLTNLSVLNLSNNNLENLPFTFMEALPKSITILHLANNNLHNIPDALCDLRRLETLNVARNGDLNTLPGDLFVHCRRLRNLNCSDTDLTYHDAEMRNLRLCNLASSAIGAPLRQIHSVVRVPTLFDIACAAVYDNKRARDKLPLSIRSVMRSNLFRCDDCGTLRPKCWRRHCHLQPLPWSIIAENVEVDHRVRSNVVLRHSSCITCYPMFPRSPSPDEPEPQYESMYARVILRYR